jgi:hypothetical protein
MIHTKAYLNLIRNRMRNNNTTCGKQNFAPAKAVTGLDKCMR